MKKHSTMKDVAAYAGVSQPTVSHVINKTASISEEVTERVLNAIADLRYVPNMVAKSLKQAKTSTIAFVIPDIDSGYYSQLAKGVEERAREHGFITFLCNTFYNPELESVYIQNLIQHKTEGIVIGYGLVKEDIFNDIHKYGIPFIIIDDNAAIGKYRVPSVEIDNLKGSYLAVQHLYDAGAKKICFASEPLFNKTLRMRFEGFKRAMTQFGYEVAQEQLYIENLEYSKMEMGYSIGAKILLSGGFDAVFASSDNLAVGIMKRFEDHNVRVPEDIIIIGYDDIPLAKLVTPTLTSISQPKYPMGQSGVDLLIDLIQGKEIKTKNILMQPSLIVRKSTIRSVNKN
jgi:LacI family transcriptional regulator